MIEGGIGTIEDRGVGPLTTEVEKEGMRGPTTETDAQTTGEGTQEIEQKGHMTETEAQMTGEEFQETGLTITLIKTIQQRNLKSHRLIK